MTQQVEDHSDDGEEKYSGRQLYSDVWTKFTVLSRKHSIASCNVCGMKLSYKATITNLKKHSEKKHNYVINKSNVMPYKVNYLFYRNIASSIVITAIDI